MVSPVTQAAETAASKARSSISLASSGLGKRTRPLLERQPPPDARRRSPSSSWAGTKPGQRKPPPSQRHSRGTRRSGLAVLLLARSTRVLWLNPNRLGPLLQEAGLVADEHRPLVCEVLDHVLAQVVAYQICVPLRLVEQSLHTIWGTVSNSLGHLPAVLTLHRSGECLQVS